MGWSFLLTCSTVSSQAAVVCHTLGPSMGTVRKLEVLPDTSSPGPEICAWLTVALMFSAKHIYTHKPQDGGDDSQLHFTLFWLRRYQYSFLSYAFIAVRYILKITTVTSFSVQFSGI